MIKGLLKKLEEATVSVLPVTAVIFACLLIFVPSATSFLPSLLVCASIVVVGITFFLFGADQSMIELGYDVGGALSKKNKMWIVLLIAFVIGFVITLAEPDLMVLAMQVAESAKMNISLLLVVIVSIGVGISMTIEIVRAIFKVSLKKLLTIVYSLTFLIMLFTPQSFVSIAFDAGSVTTGPLSVPFLISFGLGFCAMRVGHEEDEGFGLIALCSAGPILCVTIFSLFAGDISLSSISSTTSTVQTSAFQQFFAGLFSNFAQTAIVIVPLVALFVLFQIFEFKYPKTKVTRMSIGFAFVFVGISLFLTGVELAYLPCASMIGASLSQQNHALVLAICFLLGAVAIVAEPALHVLKKQVENITSGAIKQKVVATTLSFGVALSVVVATILSSTQTNILFVLAPIYAICVVLCFVNTPLFTAVSFDAGGVATGTMSVSFILPVVSSISGSGQGFGTVGIIAIFPVFLMQIVGFAYKLKLLQVKKLQKNHFLTNDIVEFDYLSPLPAKEPSNGIVEFEID